MDAEMKSLDIVSTSEKEELEKEGEGEEVTRSADDKERINQNDENDR